MKLVHFYLFTVVRFYFCLISNLFSCRYASRTLRITLLTRISSIKIWCSTWKIDCEKTELSCITWKSHKTTVTKRSGMQKLQFRLDGYVCMGQQGKIQRMHSPPGKRISVENLVGVGLQAWCAVALKRFVAFTKSGNAQEKYYRLCNVKQLEQDINLRCKPHVL